MPPRSDRGRPSGAGTVGMAASLAPQVGRRAAVTTVAVVLTCSVPSASVCSSSTHQCWVLRLVRAGRARAVIGPWPTGPAKLTVSEIGSPSSCGCCSTAFNAMAAVRPPNGPIMFQ